MFFGRIATSGVYLLAAGLLAAGCGLSIVGVAASESEGPPIAGDPADGGAGAPREDDDGGVGVQNDGGAGDGGFVDATSGPCPVGKPGPSLVEAVGGGFCIDATEVTNEQYRVFYDSPAKPAAPSYCSWNASFRPGDWGTVSPYYSLGANVPVRQVDWCDAYTYCAWAGKRLCGARSGGPINVNSFASVTESQWHYACTAGGQKTYPYGNTYAGTACFGLDCPGGGGDPTVAGSLATCSGGFPGLFDMSGNVWEWEDGCTGTSGAGDQCRLRGGSAQRGASELRCDVDNVSSRNLLPINGGIRCCSP